MQSEEVTLKTWEYGWIGAGIENFGDFGLLIFLDGSLYFKLVQVLPVDSIPIEPFYISIERFLAIYRFENWRKLEVFSRIYKPPDDITKNICMKINITLRMISSYEGHIVKRCQ